MKVEKLKFDSNARRALERGVNKLTNAVKITLGPKVQYVVLNQIFGSPTITNDGVNIAQQIELKNIFENQGAQLVLEVAIKTNNVAGDGTTTALVLAQMIVHEGLKNVAAGANPVILRGGIHKVVEAAVEAIRERSTENLRQGRYRKGRSHLGALRGDRQRHRRGHCSRSGQVLTGPNIDTDETARSEGPAGGHNQGILSGGSRTLEDRSGASIRSEENKC